MKFLRTVLITGFLIACSHAATGTQPETASGDVRRVLFIGNSLTYFNDLPLIVQQLAEAGGRRIDVGMVAFPDYNLEDHRARGDAVTEIREGRWDLVVLQQGPSSLPENRDQLRASTHQFAEDIRKAGGRPALYMVWPTADRQADFPRAIESYVLAAADVNGLLLPVGESWVAAWGSDPSAPLYSSDGLHPSPTGSYLAGLVFVGRILERSPEGLPNHVRLGSGEVLTIPPDRARLLQKAAALVNERYR